MRQRKNVIAPALKKLIPPMGVITIIGSEGSGKSGLAYSLMEDAKKEDRPHLVFGLPKQKHHLLPDWLKPTETMDWPEDAIVLVDEAHMAFYSRMSQSNANKFMDSFIGLVRQKGIRAYYLTQAGRKLDIGIVSAARLVLIKQPSLLQQKLERRELRSLLADATRAFKLVEDGKPPVSRAALKTVGKKDTTVHPYALFSTYAIANTFEGMISPSNWLPPFWSSDLSRAFAGVPLAANAVPGVLGPMGPLPSLIEGSDCIGLIGERPGHKPAEALCDCCHSGFCLEHLPLHIQQEAAYRAAKS